MNLPELNIMYGDLNKYVDVKDGLSRIMKNKKIYARLLNSFAENPHVNELHETLARRDAVEAQKAAHTIKGVAANLSLPAVNQITADMDARLKTGDAELQSELAQLDAAIDKTIQYISVVIENLDDIEV